MTHPFLVKMLCSANIKLYCQEWQKQHLGASYAIFDADGDPQHDQPADDQTPYPFADAEHGVRGERAVIDHDRRPADELQHVERREKQAADAAEAQLDRAHGAEAGAAADESGEEKHRTADDVAEQDGKQTLGEAEGREIRAGEDFGDGHGRTEPDEAVLKCRCFFHAQASCRYSGFRSNAWSIGPEPAPRSSMAASAPERYAFARCTAVSRS